MITLPDPVVFQWDKGNKNKNFDKHGLAYIEIEEAFFDRNKKILKDKLHSINEDRYLLLGKTKKNIVTFVVFTIRSNTIRVISARRLNKREMSLYEK